MQQQTGTIDCGLFAIVFAVETCFKRNLDFVSVKQVTMCEHLDRCLQSDKTTSFIKIDLNVLLCSIDQTIKINVYCMCRLLDFFDNEMVQCNF